MMIDPRDAAKHWIRQALAEEKVVQHRIDEIADRMHAVALDWERPVEECVGWIHRQGQSLRVSEWVHDCVAWAGAKKLQQEREATRKPPASEAFDPKR